MSVLQQNLIQQSKQGPEQRARFYTLTHELRLPYSLHQLCANAIYANWIHSGLHAFWNFIGRKDTFYQGLRKLSCSFWSYELCK